MQNVAKFFGKMMKTVCCNNSTYFLRFFLSKQFAVQTIRTENRNWH